MAERMKTREYSGIAALFANEFKWGKEEPAVPREFKKAYPEAHYTIINRETWPEFLLDRVKE